MQFTLQTLLLVFVIVWSSMAVFGPVGFAMALVFLAVVAWIHVYRSKSEAAVLAIIGFILVCLLLPAQHPPITGRRASCLNRLRQLGVALQHYHSTHGCFPPACIADKDGKPMHSWRVLILPFIEGVSLYEQYDFTEAWDGPNNRKLAARMPWIYSCPSSPLQPTSAITSYVAVVGPQSAWPGAEPTGLDNIPDGRANTVMLVEIANSDINWMEPRDIPFAQACRGINPATGQGISNVHFWSDRSNRTVPGVFFGFADGSVRSLSEDIPPEMLKALLTKDGGEPVDLDKYTLEVKKIEDTKTRKQSPYFALVILVVSVVLLIYRLRRRMQTVQNPADS